MLSPEYLKECISYLMGMVDIINEQMVADIARRIVKTGDLTETARFESEKIIQQNKLLKDLIKDISKYTELTEEEISNIFKNAYTENLDTENLRAAIAGKTPLDHEGSAFMGSLLYANIAKTKGVVTNLTKTTAKQAENAFINACNLASMQVSSGAFTYDTAIKNAIKKVAKSGLTVQYPSGHVDKIDVAIRRAVLTGVNQTAAEMNLKYCEEIGTDLVEVTAHAGARPEHAEWQGGVYSLSGKSKGYASLVEATGYGTGPGLCGWNCRHNFYAYYEGSPRTYTKEYLDNLDRETYESKGQTYTNYEAGQKQRAYERVIREEKRYLAGLNSAYNEATSETLKTSLRAEMESSAVNLKRTEANMKIFCKETKRKVDTTRTQVYAARSPSGKIVGFDKSAAQRAKQIAIKHHKDWLRSIGAENSTLNTLEKYYTAKYNKSEEYIKLFTRSKELSMLKRKNSEYTKNQFDKCLKLYGESEKRGFIASSHFMEKFIERELGNNGGVRFTIDDVIKTLNEDIKYVDIRNGRFVKEGNKIFIILEDNRLVTLREGRVEKRWKKV